MHKVRVAVAGASGYTGVELVRLLCEHAHVELAAVTSEKSAGLPLASVFPHLSHTAPLTFEALAPQALAARADVIFLALPHTKSLEAVADCMRSKAKIIDLSADYRLHDARSYEQWYQVPHTHPDLLNASVYGLPELHRADIAKSQLVAAPGCYPTAAVLQLAPLAAHGLIDPATIVIDAKSGVSGAGRSPALPYHFPEAHESLEPYKIGRHRHIPEIEQELSRLYATHRPGKGGAMSAQVTVAFTPHLVPMNRGILSTAYCRLTDAGQDAATLLPLYKSFYEKERFIRILQDGVPNPRYVKGTNYCDLALFADNRAGWIITVAALDNLIKGAAGQAIQAMNLMLGIPEETGLTAASIFP